MAEGTDRLRRKVYASRAALLSLGGRHDGSHASDEALDHDLHGPCTCAIQEAALTGDVALIQQLFESGADVHARSAHGITALHLAAREGHNEAVQRLLGAGADPNAATNVCYYQATTLFAAAMMGHVGVVQQLLNAGGRFDVGNSHGYTPLHAAAGSGQLAVVQLLIGAGANVSTPAIAGHTALHEAAADKHHGVVTLLMANNAHTQCHCARWVDTSA